MSFTNRTAAGVLNALFGKTSVFGTLSTAPANMFVALFTTQPGEDGSGGVEATGTGYARESTAPADWNAATEVDPAVVDNLNIVDFGIAGGEWSSGANMVAFGLYDAITAGNLILSSPLTVPKPVAQDDPVTFPAGSLQVTLD